MFNNIKPLEQADIEAFKAANIASYKEHRKLTCLGEAAKLIIKGRRIK